MALNRLRPMSLSARNSGRSQSSNASSWAAFYIVTFLVITVWAVKLIAAHDGSRPQNGQFLPRWIQSRLHRRRDAVVWMVLHVVILAAVFVDGYALLAACLSGMRSFWIWTPEQPKVGFFLVKWLMISYLCVASGFVLVFTGMLACFSFFSVVQLATWERSDGGPGDGKSDKIIR